MLFLTDKIPSIGRLALVLAAAGIVFSCTPRKTKKENNLKDLVFDQRAVNVALLFGASNGLEGVATDLREFRALLESPTYGFGFKVVVVNETTSEQMIQTTQQYAAQVGERGTLLWYYSGHGAQGSGCMATNSKCISFAPVARAIQQARATPIKRFFFFADSCFSGQLVNGSSAILSGGSGNLLAMNGAPDANYSIRDPGVNEFTNRSADDVFNALQGIQNDNMATRASGVFEQALTMSAARGDETSIDLGADGGGAFTSSLRQTLGNLRNNPAATIRDLVTQSTSMTQSQYQHTPAYRSIPGDVVLNDRLFGGDMGSSQGGGVGGGTGNFPLPSAQISDISVALGSAGNSAAARVYVAVPRGTSKVAICRGALDQCRSNPTESVSFVAFEGPFANRSLFRSTVPIPLINGEAVLVFAISAQGQIVDSRAIQLRQK